jgi:hypothetical protein
MTRASAAANGLMVAAYQVAMMQHVPCFRMQSRVFTVVGAGGRQRPMNMGEWTDDLGVKHTSGMADWLMLPTIRTNMKGELQPKVATPSMTLTIVASTTGICVPLWVECKAQSGRLEKSQKEFRDYVEGAGAFYLELRDSADELLQWFDAHGVAKP